MFERFTERARMVVVLAQEEARALKHNYIGTEHILLGLVRAEDGLAALALGTLGITLEEVRVQVVNIVGEGDFAATGQIPFTPRAKRTLELARDESLSLGHNYIGTEHILLGLVRAGEGVAVQALQHFEVDAEKIRNEVVRMLGEARRRHAAAPRPSGENARLHAERGENARLHAAIALLSAAVQNALEAATASQNTARAQALEDVERSLEPVADKLLGLQGD